MRDLRDVTARGGAGCFAEVTVDEDADANISPGFTDKVEFDVAGFFSDDRVGAGGRTMGDPARRCGFS